MARKTRPRKDRFPTYEELEQRMLERRREISKELRQLLKRQDRIEETILSRRTRRGTPLTERGLRGLLSDLRSIHYRQVSIMDDDREICQRVATMFHNEVFYPSHEKAA